MFSDRILNILYTRLAHDINQMKIIVNVLGREREREERESQRKVIIYTFQYIIIMAYIATRTVAKRLITIYYSIIGIKYYYYNSWYVGRS